MDALPTCTRCIGHGYRRLTSGEDIKCPHCGGTGHEPSRS